LQGVAPAIPKAELVQGYGKEGQQQEYAPSGLASGISAGAGIAAILKTLGIV
jgi:hypothetical protein